MRKTAVLLALMAMSMSDVFAATGKVVTTNYVQGALESLDAAQVGANGSYIQYVSETDGIVSATAKAFDTSMSSTSTNAVQNKVVNAAISNLQTAVGGKQATLTTTNVTTSGGGNVVTAVTASNGTVTVTKGTTLGSLATKSAVGSSDITDGSIATADIANGAVTAGIFGFIPSGSEGASTTAAIWVE